MMDITVALGGGGVKGFAHVGVLRGLEQRGYRIRAVAGTSAGGLVGSLYAAGYSLDQIEALLVETDQGKLYNRLPGDGPSLLGLGGVVEVLEHRLGEKTFADLSLPFAVTGVDLNTGEAVVLNRGRLLDAVLATIAVPGVFPPREWEGRLLIDGGILDPVPVALARRLAPNVPVVAVVLSPGLQDWANRQSPPRLLASIPFLSRLGQLRWAQSLSIFLRSVDMAGCLLTDLRLQVDRPEVIIRPQVDPYGLVDHVDVRELVVQGEAAIQAAEPELRRWVGWRRGGPKRNGNTSSALPGKTSSQATYSSEMTWPPQA